ncbi:hypothetical protein HN784_03130 [bacterium]|jgi:hypothetical protein|nr:hypothetical protein [bacterium]MBT4251287.1 hypothetical protein [bacterium]MBT4598332.1 hypothetical protein [bacterium]MBT6754165.1 hypothetical protein [bacterium]MBT7037985.1 hypothetical protein [bacterium]
MAEPGGKLPGKKNKGRRAGIKTKGRKKATPKNVATRKARSKKGSTPKRRFKFW